MQYVTFNVGEILYGVSILTVREISRLYNITPVQGADSRIDGLINLRGQIVAVLNLGSCFKLTAVSHENKSRLIILKKDDELSKETIAQGIGTCVDNIALLVNSIGDVVNAVGTEIEPAPANAAHEYVSGVIKLENNLLTLLSTKWLGKIRT